MGTEQSIKYNTTQYTLFRSGFWKLKRIIFLNELYIADQSQKNDKYMKKGVIFMEQNLNKIL